jgi:beta-1,4-mannooligosaccharide/beta-1,4-mannosyl-N-acetylglucosamine phosphorylase
MADEIKKLKKPVLQSGDIPYPAGLVFNAGIAKYQGKYVMVFRNDVGYKPDGYSENRYTDIGVATSNDGITWDVKTKPWITGVPFEDKNSEIQRYYDPRLTVIDGICYMCFAVDTRHGVCGGILKTEDFDKYEVLTMSAPDNRNMVLFPEKIGGRYFRLERPFPEYSRGYVEKFDIWSSASPDLRYWGETKLLLGTEQVPYANSKIGPAAPPVKTSKGWLTTIHAVYKHKDKMLKAWAGQKWDKEYLGGLMLLDLEDPTKVIGLCPEPILKAELAHELDGFRGSVIFPGGMILEDSGEVKIYYGAADTVECLATAHIDDLLKMCKSFGNS